MQSVYADTLRWGRELKSGPTPCASRARRTVAPLRVAREPHLLLSEMASAVARKALERCFGKENGALDQIIVCATSFEQDLALSCASRLHSELKSKGAPFALGQLQGVSFFLALQLVSDMMAQVDPIRCALIVSAERWLPPFSRRVGSLTTFGDGAAAVLIRRDVGPGWYVLGIGLRTPSPPIAGAHLSSIDETTVVEVIEQTCAQARMAPEALDWILPPSINEALARSVSARARLSGRMWYPHPNHAGFLCTADAPAQLDALLRSAVASEGRCILLWSAGFQGQAACAILQYRGARDV